MKHRFTLLFALLCASMMTWAAEWTGQVTGTATNVWLDGIGSNEERTEVNYTVNYLVEYNAETLTITLGYTEDNFNKTVGLVPQVFVNGVHKGNFGGVTWSSTEFAPGAELNIYFYFAYNEGSSNSSHFSYTIPSDGGGEGTEPGVIDWNSISWLVNGTGLEEYNNKYKAVVTPVLPGTGINNLQTNKDAKSIHIAFPSAVFGAISLGNTQYHIEGAGMFVHLDAFTQQYTEFTVVCEGTTYTFTVYNDNGEPEDLTGWNIAKGKTSVAGHYPNENRRPSLANDGKIEDGDSRWASDGAKHYAAEGENAEDWWYVDLGDFYSIETIKILFETASPTDYDLLISNNALTWTVIGTYTEAPKTGNSAENYNVYEFSDKVGRYVKIFARNGYSNLAYGFSMYEFEVYGERASVSDVTPPTMGTVSLSGTPTYDKISIAVSATDTEDGMVSSFHVVDETNGINQSYEAVDGVITITGLNEDITYNFIITAVDAAGNESENAATIQASTTIDNTIPQSNAAVPTATNKDVLPIYSDAFASILAHTFDKDGWAGVALYKEKNIGGDSYLLYNIASANEIIWGMYDDGANAIIAAEGYRAEGHMGVDASAMEYLHIDLWSEQACNIGICINDQSLKNQVAHTGSGWEGFDIPLSEFNVDADVNKQTNNVRWFKFNNLGSITGKVAIDNVYFWKNATGFVSLSASVNDATMGTATVKQGDVEVTEVATGSEVTFSAVANDGYVFVEWSNGEKNATFSTTVNTTTHLTATFRELGTTYCNTLVQSDNGDQEHDAYVTMKRTAENEYTLVVRSAEAMLNFGGTNFFMQPNTHVIDLRNQGTLSADKRTLIATFSAEKEPYMTTPLYVVLDGGFEAHFPQLTNIEYAISCEDPEITAMVLNHSTAVLETGNTITLEPIFTPAFMSADVTWETSNADVATVSNGIVTAVGAGEATITAKVSETIKATCIITVQTATAHNWYGYATDQELDYTYRIEYTIDHHIVAHVKRQGEKVGLVDASMLIGDKWTDINNIEGEEEGWKKGVTEQTYTIGEELNILIQSNYAGEPSKIYINYIVGSDNTMPTIEPSQLSLNTNSLTLGVSDEDIQLVAEIHHCDAANKTLTWTSSNEAAVTVVDGKVHPVAVGTATITATTHNGISATCVVTVVGALEPATWYGVTTIQVNGNPVGVNYSITRTSERKLQFYYSLAESIVGLANTSVVFKGTPETWNTMMKLDANERTAEFTSESTYIDGSTIGIFFHLPFTGGVGRWDVDYTVGSSNEKPNTLVAFGDQADNTAKITEYADELVDAYINRTFPNTDEWYTLCLPFDMDETQLAETFGAGYTLATLGNSEDRGSLIHLNFNYVNTLEAGKPYLLKPGVSTVTVPMIEAVTIKSAAPQKAESAYMHFQGTFAPTTLEGDNKRFVGPNNYLYSPAESGTTMGAFRCYFTIPVESQALVGSKAARIVFGPQVTTGTENVQSDQVQSTKVMIDGTLYIIRGERTYNAQGQLVK